MPVALFIQRLERARAARNFDARDESEKWLLGLWAQARTLYYGLTGDHDPPPTKKDYERQKKGKPPDWPKVEQARAQKDAFDKAWSNAIEDPKHFGKLMGMTSILGEPEPESVSRGILSKSAEERAKTRIEIAEREQRMIAQLRSYAETTGNAPI